MKASACRPIDFLCLLPLENGVKIAGSAHHKCIVEEATQCPETRVEQVLFHNNHLPRRHQCNKMSTTPFDGSSSDEEIVPIDEYSAENVSHRV